MSVAVCGSTSASLSDPHTHLQAWGTRCWGVEAGPVVVVFVLVFLFDFGGASRSAVCVWCVGGGGGGWGGGGVGGRCVGGHKRQPSDVALPW